MKARMNNKGFSLVELIVVVMIMAVIAGGAVVSISIVYNANVERTAKTLNACMTEAHHDALTYSDDSVSLELERVDGSWQAKIMMAGRTEPLDTQSLGNNKVSIALVKYNVDGTLDDTSPLPFEPEDGDKITFTYSKKTGGIKGITVEGTTIGSLNVSTSEYRDIRVTGSGEPSNIVIIPETGRTFVEE